MYIECTCQLSAILLAMLAIGNGNLFVLRVYLLWKKLGIFGFSYNIDELCYYRFLWVVYKSSRLPKSPESQILSNKMNPNLFVARTETYIILSQF